MSDDIEAELLKVLPCQRPDDPCQSDEPEARKCEDCYRRPAVAQFCRGLVREKQAEIYIQNESIARLLAKVAELEQNQHDENCDTRDLMIQGKPCNCYALIGKKYQFLINRKYQLALMRVAELEQRCLNYENEIAESCPEDFSVKETVEGLRKQLAAERAEREKATKWTLSK